VRILVERGRLHLHGAHFGIATGELRVRDPETGAFRLAVPEAGTSPTRLIRCQDTGSSGG
jgi:carbonic anhydrase